MFITLFTEAWWDPMLKHFNPAVFFTPHFSKIHPDRLVNLQLCLQCGLCVCQGKILRGSLQKFCTLYVFSLKMNLFYKIHLQAFNVNSIVLYHNGLTFGQVLYSCLDAFVVDASDYSGHLIRHLLNVSEAFPKEWFLQFWEQVKVWWAEPTRF
jgi:hypothetical protein